MATDGRASSFSRVDDFGSCLPSGDERKGVAILKALHFSGIKLYLV